MLRDIAPINRYGLTRFVAPDTFSPVMLPAVYSFTRDSVALKAPRFPILTLDERQLTSALGFIFDVRWLVPGESMVSILWKSARVNGLAGHTLVQLMRPDVDPYEDIEPMRDVIDVKRMRLPAQPRPFVCGVRGTTG